MPVQAQAEGVVLDCAKVEGWNYTHSGEDARQRPATIDAHPMHSQNNRLKLTRLYHFLHPLTSSLLSPTALAVVQ